MGTDELTDVIRPVHRPGRSGGAMGDRRTEALSKRIQGRERRPLATKDGISSKTFRDKTPWRIP
ncbi:hypothetical protein RvY_03798 [Ramazzottius varieornatus]|uniref:Uncharacterized protein n=1 Tax=Ramazzottius varieornatus TaxID=947166 RepID=A0A1D1USS2_RAMVA|nr:hypothetical protein RvY_03798 [Ramazzottius varieornatus]